MAAVLKKRVVAEFSQVLQVKHYNRSETDFGRKMRYYINPLSRKSPYSTLFFLTVTLWFRQFGLGLACVGKADRNRDMNHMDKYIRLTHLKTT